MKNLYVLVLDNNIFCAMFYTSKKIALNEFQKYVNDVKNGLEFYSKTKKVNYTIFGEKTMCPDEIARIDFKNNNENICHCLKVLKMYANYCYHN